MSNAKLSQSRKRFWQWLTALSVIILVSNPLSITMHFLGYDKVVKTPSVLSVVEADEIYPMFTCPCCDEPLDKDEPCCESAAQMSDFISQKISSGASKDEIIVSTAKEFGLDRLVNEDLQQKVKDILSANAPKDSARLSADETIRDLGIVKMSLGIVTAEFKIKNGGNSDLIIDQLSSSCGCTSGSIVYHGEEGPRFYMPGHGFDVPDPSWKVAISPGDAAEVKIYYDPNVHKDLRGPVTREITVHSNDPITSNTKFTITLDQEE